MNGLLTVLPLAFVMIAGPQIISAVFLATSRDWGRNTLAYVAGAAVSITLVVSIAYFVVGEAKGGSGRSEGGEGHLLDAVLLALLVFLAGNVFRKRGEGEPPKWMGKLQAASAGFSLRLGFLLLGVFPTDIATSFAVGSRLAREGDPWWHALGFVVVTLLLLATPALLVVVMGRRAQAFLPKARDWMSKNSWMVSEAVILLFIGITINSLVSS